MARQAGPLFITGTIGDIIFYKLGDHYYMRQKGEPTPATKKRMSQPEHYRLLCLRKQEFKQASQMVREWYYTLPKAVRKHGLFGTLTGKALEWLRAGKTKEEIKALGLKAAMPKQKVNNVKSKNTSATSTKAEMSLHSYLPVEPLNMLSASSLSNACLQTNQFINPQVFVSLKTLPQKRQSSKINS